jgi:hypothetical protein
MALSTRDNSSSTRPVMSATRARQGRYGRHVFWVLLFGTLLAALGLFAAWTWRAGDLAKANVNDGPSRSAAAFHAPEPAAIVPQPAQTGTAPETNHTQPDPTR